MTTDYATLSSLYLSRLRRCDMWSEQSRYNGSINLMGADRRGNTRLETCDESVMVQMLKDGLIACDAQQRIAINDNYMRPKPIEVTVKYWHVTTTDGAR